MQKARSLPTIILRNAHPIGMHANAHWRMDMNRAWLATSATALLAAAAIGISATQAGARDDHHNGHVNQGAATHFRSGPAPTVQHFQSAPQFRSGPAPTVQHFQSAPQFRSGPAPTARHFESAPQFRSAPVQRHVETAPNFRTGNPPQVHFNGVYNSRAERLVRRHHRFHAPVFVTIPHVYEPGYYAYDECYVWQQALTPLGWRYVWMNICDDDY